jgi:serine/threonine protein kinase
LSLAIQKPINTSVVTVATQVTAPAGSGITPKRLGPIQLVRLIGKGGMGEVWLGRHEFLGRDVAVKLLTHAVMDKKDPSFTTFIAGARVAASLEHAGLNKIFNADIVDGVPYLSCWTGRTSANLSIGRDLWIFRSHERCWRQ